MPRAAQEYHNFRIPVTAEFEEVFSHFYFAENNTDAPLSKTLLPNFQTLLVFGFGPKITLQSKLNTILVLDKCIVLGPVKQAFTYTLPVNAQMLVANFKDDAFYRFFGKAITDGHVPFNPDELLAENCFTNLWHELQKIAGINEKVDFILAFCKPYLRHREGAFKPLSNFDNQNHSLNPIKAIAKETNQSERNVQLNHKKFLGYSAKEINRYHRFLKATELIQQSLLLAKKLDWFEVIHACNYYDQSQLIRDFKHFINLSPKQYLNFQQDICDSKV